MYISRFPIRSPFVFSRGGSPSDKFVTRRQGVTYGTEGPVEYYYTVISVKSSPQKLQFNSIKDLRSLLNGLWRLRENSLESFWNSSNTTETQETHKRDKVSRFYIAFKSNSVWFAVAIERKSQSFVRFKNNWGVVFSISLHQKTMAT